MAFLENTAFEPRIVNNEFNALCNITGKYSELSGDAPQEADCSAGTLCVRGDLLPCEGFPGVYNENAWVMLPAASDASLTARDVVYACNTYDAKKIDGYYIGTETLGLGASAGEYCTFTRIDFDEQSVYRFGVGNISGEAQVGGYLTIDNGSLSPATEIPTPAGTPYFTVRGTGNFIEGTTDSFGYVDVVACRA